jgi:hypothetical protein
LSEADSHSRKRSKAQKAQEQEQTYHLQPLAISWSNSGLHFVVVACHREMRALVGGES